MSENIKEEITNFQNWFKNSKVKKGGKPVIVYHGTLGEFDTFDISKTSPETFWGKGFYFSSSIKDVNHNYATPEGEDYKNKLANTIDNISEERSYEWDEDAYSHKGKDYFPTDEEINHENKLKALQEIGVTHNGLVMPVYLSMQNPLTEKTQWMNGRGFEATDTLKEVIDYLNSKKFKKYLDSSSIELDNFEKSGIAQNLFQFTEYELSEGDTIEWDKFSEFLQNDCCMAEEAANFIAQTLEDKFEDNVTVDYKSVEYITNRLQSFLIESVPRDSYTFREIEKNLPQITFSYFENKFDSYSEDYSFNAYEFLQHLKDNAYEFYDPSSEFPTFTELLSQFLKSEGYDGIIMNAKKQFSSMKMDASTKHYICWSPTQIKSAIGNNGQYSVDNENILYRIADKIDFTHPIMPLSEVKETILEFSSKMDNFVKFRVFDSVEEAEKLEYLPKNSDENTKGFFFESKEKGNFIGIIRNNIESRQDLLTTYVHEAVGHSSIKNILGDNYKPTMIRLFDFYNHKHKKLFNPYNDKFFSSEQKVKKAEEFLAVSIERKFNTGFSGIKLLVGAALNKVRKIFPELPITSFETDYIEKSAFNFYQKNEIKEIALAQIVQEEITGRNLVLNIQRTNKNSNSGKQTP